MLLAAIRCQKGTASSGLYPAILMKISPNLSASLSCMRLLGSSNASLLTRREKEVLELIAEGMTNNVIAQKLFISPATVDTHWKNLLAKLNAKNTASLIRMASQLQLI